MVWVAPVRVSVTVTVAPGTGAPASFVTWPWMEVVICWATAAVGATVTAANGTTMAAQLHSNANLFTEIYSPGNSESVGEPVTG